jgi:hypothetical protein
MNPKLTVEEIRMLRREVHGKGGLVSAGFITITPAGKKWIAQDDERVKRERAEGGTAGGRPITKKGGKK